ncbi:MAG: phosphoribosylglycinamide formyltransferase [Anaerolineae bacterium]|jgi:formyltetrahydrofolate-dependent phosphoribosylglycinamide formyltransferase
MKRIAVLVSGRGSNLQAIHEACVTGRLPDAAVVAVVANRQASYGLRWAIERGIPSLYHPLARYREWGRPREAYDADLAAIMLRYQPDVVALAGWMHLFSMAFLQHFRGRVLNIHPALPGTYAGTHAIERAFEAYQRGEITRTGVMVHRVPDEAVDEGPVVLQRAVPILPDDTLEALEERIHAVEHNLYPEAIAKVLAEG